MAGRDGIPGGIFQSGDLRRKGGRCNHCCGYGDVIICERDMRWFKGNVGVGVWLRDLLVRVWREGR